MSITELLSWFPYVAGFVAAAIIVLLVYFFYLRPRMQLPLEGERVIGYLRIWLKEHGEATGYATTAKRTLEKWVTEIIENVDQKTVRAQLQTAKNEFGKYWPFAHKVGGETRFYLCTQNIEDSRFMDVDPDRGDGRIVHGVQDVVSLGEWHGTKFFGVKLGEDTRAFSDDERDNMNVLLELAKFVRDAAQNTGKLAEMKQERDDYKASYEQETKEKAQMRSQRDRAVSALAQKNLEPEGEAKLGAPIREKLKEWFSKWQLATGLIGYLVSPYIVNFIQANYGYLQGPAATVYASALITLFAFFCIPIFRKVLGRWL